jgi:hypothetical protein
LRRAGDSGVVARQRRRVVTKAIDLASHARGLIDRLPQIRLGPLQLTTRLIYCLALSPQGVQARAGLPILGRQMLHRFAMFLELSSRIRHKCGGLLGLPHDLRHLLHLHPKRFEAGDALVETLNALGDRCKLLGGVNCLVLDVRERCRDLGELAMAPVKLLKQGVECITLVTSGKNNRVQFVGALLRFASEGQLFEHVRLRSAAIRPT